MTLTEYQPSFPAFVTPEEAKGLTIQERFEAFNRANPWVYAEICRLTRAYRAKQHGRVGVKFIIEVLRWQWAMTTDSSDGWKLNNNHASRYSRLIMDNEPDLADAYEQRELKAI